MNELPRLAAPQRGGLESSLLIASRTTVASRLYNHCMLSLPHDVPFAGDDKMRSGVDLRGASPLASFNYVTDPHFVTFSNILYPTGRNSKPNPNRNPTVITDSQIDPRGPQIVTVQIRPASHFVACRLLP